MSHKAKIGLGIATFAMALAIVPAVSASASVRTVAGTQILRPVESSSLCTDYKAEEKASAGTQSSAYLKAIESGNWPAIQKALLTTFNGEGNAQKEMVGALSGAPGNVKSAANVVLKFDGTLKSIIQKSTSMTGFTSGVTNAENSPNVKAALATLDAYTKKLCPGLIPNTTTPST